MIHPATFKVHPTMVQLSPIAGHSRKILTKIKEITNKFRLVYNYSDIAPKESFEVKINIGIKDQF